MGSPIAAAAPTIIRVPTIACPTPPAGETGGGVGHAIVGTLLIVGAAAAMGLPFGIGAGSYSAEFAGTRLATITRVVADVW
jgi:phosphate transport system permease protein